MKNGQGDRHAKCQPHLQHTGEAATVSERAAQRSMLWGAIAEALSYPDQELLLAIREGTVAATLQRLLEKSELGLLEDIEWVALTDGGIVDDDLATEYTRLFDTGANKSACPLYGGMHISPQMKAMEEVVRFYSHFGLTITGDERETPDHIITELEFLHFLAYGESEKAYLKEETSNYERAQRDFNARHLGRWIPRARDRLSTANPLRYYSELFRLLDECLKADLDRLQSKHGRASLTPASSQML